MLVFGDVNVPQLHELTPTKKLEFLPKNLQHQTVSYIPSSFTMVISKKQTVRYKTQNFTIWGMGMYFQKVKVDLCENLSSILKLNHHSRYSRDEVGAVVAKIAAFIAAFLGCYHKDNQGSKALF